MSDIVFMDTETLGLDVDAPIWEFAAIRRDGETGEDYDRMHLFIDHKPEPWILPEPFATDYRERFAKARELSRITQPRTAAELIFSFLSGRPHIVGAVPSFDTERISRQLLQPAKLPNPWHYHLILADAYELWHEKFDGAERDMISRLRIALDQIAEGLR